MIELLEDRVYKGLEIDNEIINHQVEKELEEIQGKAITKEGKRRRNVQKVKKETI